MKKHQGNEDEYKDETISSQNVQLNYSTTGRGLNDDQQKQHTNSEDGDIENYDNTVAESDDLINLKHRQVATPRTNEEQKLKQRPDNFKLR